MSVPMSVAQQAQQNNRDRDGRYAENQLADPGSNIGLAGEPDELTVHASMMRHLIAGFLDTYAEGLDLMRAAGLRGTVHLTEHIFSDKDTFWTGDVQLPHSGRLIRVVFQDGQVRAHHYDDKDAWQRDLPGSIEQAVRAEAIADNLRAATGGKCQIDVFHLANGNLRILDRHMTRAVVKDILTYTTPLYAGADIQPDGTFIPTEGTGEHLSERTNWGRIARSLGLDNPDSAAAQRGARSLIAGCINRADDHPDMQWLAAGRHNTEENR